jgi:hypothetical protein
VLEFLSYAADNLVHASKLEKRSEVAHALYSAQLCFGKGDKLSTAQISLSTLAIEEITTLEAGLGLFLGIWARLLADSTDIYQWLKNPTKSVSQESGTGYRHRG